MLGGVEYLGVDDRGLRSFDRESFGAFADVMVEDAAGTRVLLAPDGRVRDFVSATYSFDEHVIEPVDLYERLDTCLRGVAGVRGHALIVNFPGNPKAIEQSWPIVGPTLEHAAKLLERS